MHRLTALELEGFQSIKRKTRIDLSKIALLYGPNSAGKSAISDALEFFRFFSAFKRYEPAIVFAMVDRWASRLNVNDNDWQVNRDREDGYKHILQYRTMRLAVEFEIELVDPYEEYLDGRNSPILANEEQLVFGGEDNFPYNKGDPQQAVARIECAFAIRGSGIIEENYVFLNELIFSLNGKPVAYLGCQDPIGKRGADRSLRNTEMFAWVYEGIFLSSSVREEVHAYESKRRAANTEWKRKDPQYVTKDSAGNLVYWANHSFDWDNFYEVHSSDCYFPFDEIKVAIRLNFRDINFYFLGILNKMLSTSPSVVTADRSIPEAHRISSIVDLKYSDGWWPANETSPISPMISLQAQSVKIDPHWKELARAAYSKSLEDALNSSFWGSDWASGEISELVEKYALSDYRDLAERFDRINEYLGNELFIQNMYQVQASSILLVPLDLRKEDPYDAYYLLSQPAAVSLHLVGADGGQVEFRDVGSGIPFVIPVLVAVTQSGVKFIQQPELHLHPSLQSRLADIFIDSISRHDGPLVIETHSEHVLLRLLRRIRQTTKNSEAPYPLTTDDLAVYYFDHQPSGESIVTRQFVTPLGDFYNDWPKGFFNERDEDLFGE